MKIKEYFDEKKNSSKENKKLFKYFDKNNVSKYYIKEKYKYFSFNVFKVFNNFLYNKEI